ncbi:hypothetical protein J4732_12715 [Serratia marcescens]|uniref:Uncharacterized protein n=1 Tax=Serratia marcescens TaxID=615 RepID=A0A939NP64_SERMA|nr:hypothetical protein [Serratia marcescens]
MPSSRVIVGRPSRKTPLMSSALNNGGQPAVERADHAGARGHCAEGDARR